MISLEGCRDRSEKNEAEARGTPGRLLQWYEFGRYRIKWGDGKGNIPDAHGDLMKAETCDLVVV